MADPDNLPVDTTLGGFWHQLGLTWDWLTKPTGFAAAETFPGPQVTPEQQAEADAKVNAATHQGIPTDLGKTLQEILHYVFIAGVVLVALLGALIVLDFVSFLPRRSRA